MAVLDYPATLGYRSWFAWQAYTADEPAVVVSPYVSGERNVPVIPYGVLLWRGSFETPLFGPRDERWVTMRTLMEDIDSGRNQLRITTPTEQRSDLLAASLVVQPFEVSPPVRRSRGETGGWTVEWWEVPQDGGN